MIENFASVCGPCLSEFLDLNHTGRIFLPISFIIPKFARAREPQCWANFGIGTFA